MTLCSSDVFDLMLTLQSFQQRGLGLADCSRWLYGDVFNKVDSNHFLVVFLSYNRKQCDGEKNHFNDKVEKHVVHNTHVGTRGVELCDKLPERTDHVHFHVKRSM